ncbi:stage II sporulation protein M [soil metagenome]
MTVDEFIARNGPSWQRLGELTNRAGRRASTLTAGELDELVSLYQRTSTHLSLARSRFADPALSAQLTQLVARSGAVVYGTRPRTLRAATRFVTETFPAALWHSRWFVLVATLLLVVPALAVGAWIAVSPEALEASGPEALRQAYIEEDFEAYYSELGSTEFFATVATNNIQVGILSFAAGVLLCLPTAYVMALNGANLGFAGGLFHAAGEAARFWGLILPHGLLELTAVFVAGGSGLRLGWAIVDPGDRRRSDALVEEGRRAVVIVLGLVGVFIVSGLIEGYVTGSGLPTSLRVGIGLTAEAAFLAYAGVLGHQAARRGLTGALGESDQRRWTREAAT